MAARTGKLCLQLMPVRSSGPEDGGLSASPVGILTSPMGQSDWLTACFWIRTRDKSAFKIYLDCKLN